MWFQIYDDAVTDEYSIHYHFIARHVFSYMGTITIMYMIYIDMVFQEVHTEVHVMTLTLELLISLGVWEDGIKISIAGDLWSDNKMAIVAMGLLTTGR